MGIILCPTRGGPQGYRNQDKAIAYAKIRDDLLIFLYVVDLHFLDKTAAPVVVDVGNEIQDMGEFMLLMAKERAKERGIDAKTILRKGKVREEIKAVALEENATLILLGRPGDEKSAFQISELEEYAAEIEKETGIKSIIY
ncbi:MAG: universal stress protein [Chloroflexota bacterium]|nr:MAG: universal stress protein [Chloroflexota bacterium]